MTENKIQFEDLIAEIMLAEEAATPQALRRWQERYPQFRDRLDEFFTNWSLQETLAASLPPAEVNEERIVSRGVAHAMDILRRQGRLLSNDAPVPALQTFDQIVLAGVFMMGGKGFGRNLAERIGELWGREVLLGSVLAALDRLERQNLVSATSSDPAGEADGKSRRYFAITLFGQRALNLAKETSKEVTDFLGDWA